MSPERTAARRADIEAKQELVAGLLEPLGCEAALLLLPVHVAWFTAGLVARGLVADNERPAIYTNGRQRWLICSNVDSQRLFDEELDQLGFQVKEWTWHQGRADLLHDLCQGRKMACDRPITNMAIINEKLRPPLRVPTMYERDDLVSLGALVVHAVEATARSLRPGDTEEEAAGQIGHRLLHHGAEPIAIDVTADERSRKYRRAGFTSASAKQTLFLQATAQRLGLFVTVGRTVAFQPLEEKLRTEYDHAARLAASFRSISVPGETITSAVTWEARLLAESDYEFEARLCPPAHTCGRYAAEELRRGGQDEPFEDGLPLIWQARVGAMAVVDTVLVGKEGPVVLTPSENWPIKRIRVGEQTHDVPDVLVQ